MGRFSGRSRTAPTAAKHCRGAATWEAPLGAAEGANALPGGGATAREDGLAVASAPVSRCGRGAQATKSRAAAAESQIPRPRTRALLFICSPPSCAPTASAARESDRERVIEGLCRWGRCAVRRAPAVRYALSEVRSAQASARVGNARDNSARSLQSRVLSRSFRRRTPLTWRAVMAPTSGPPIPLECRRRALGKSSMYARSAAVGRAAKRLQLDCIGRRRDRYPKIWGLSRHTE